MVQYGLWVYKAGIPCNDIAAVTFHQAQAYLPNFRECSSLASTDLYCLVNCSLSICIQEI